MLLRKETLEDDYSNMKEQRQGSSCPASGRMVKHSKAEFGRTYVYGPSFDASPMTKDVTKPKDIQTENLSFLHWSERGSISSALFPQFQALSIALRIPQTHTDASIRLPVTNACLGQQY